MKKEVRVANEKAVWRLRKANQLQRDFTRQVLDPSFLCPMFALPDGAVMCRASDRDVALAVSEELRRANDVALKSKKKELEEMNRKWGNNDNSTMAAGSKFTLRESLAKGC